MDAQLKPTHDKAHHSDLSPRRSSHSPMLPIATVTLLSTTVTRGSSSRMTTKTSVTTVNSTLDYLINEMETHLNLDLISEKPGPDPHPTAGQQQASSILIVQSFSSVELQIKLRACQIFHLIAGSTMMPSTNQSVKEWLQGIPKRETRLAFLTSSSVG